MLCDLRGNGGFAVYPSIQKNEHPVARVPTIAFSPRLFGHLAEMFFSCPAKRALPIFRQVIKIGARWYLPFSVSFCLIKNIPAIWCLTLPHSDLLEVQLVCYPRIGDYRSLRYDISHTRQILRKYGRGVMSTYDSAISTRRNENGIFRIGSLRRGHYEKRSVSACEQTETYSPAAIDMAPATRPATPATRMF